MKVVLFELVEEECEAKLVHLLRHPLDLIHLQKESYKLNSLESYKLDQIIDFFDYCNGPCKRPGAYKFRCTVSPGANSRPALIRDPALIVFRAWIQVFIYEIMVTYRHTIYHLKAYRMENYILPWDNRFTKLEYEKIRYIGHNVFLVFYGIFNFASPPELIWDPALINLERVLPPALNWNRRLIEPRHLLGPLRYFIFKSISWWLTDMSVYCSSVLSTACF